MRKIYIDDPELKRLTLKICRDIERSSWQPDRIVGIGRGGLTPAVLMSHWFGVPMVSLDVSLRDSGMTQSNTWLPEDVMAGVNTLIVDDINDSGATFAWIRNDWQLCASGIPWHHTVRFASVVHNLASLQISDYSGMEINKTEDPCWIFFPWENWWERI
jgi:hypoxanthine phosphoribosyltransferase